MSRKFDQGTEDSHFDEARETAKLLREMNRRLLWNGLKIMNRESGGVMLGFFILLGVLILAILGMTLYVIQLEGLEVVAESLALDAEEFSVFEIWIVFMPVLFIFRLPYALTLHTGFYNISGSIQQLFPSPLDRKQVVKENIRELVILFGLLSLGVLACALLIIYTGVTGPASSLLLLPLGLFALNMFFALGCESSFLLQVKKWNQMNILLQLLMMGFLFISWMTTPLLLRMAYQHPGPGFLVSLGLLGFSYLMATRLFFSNAERLFYDEDGMPRGRDFGGQTLDSHQEGVGQGPNLIFDSPKGHSKYFKPDEKTLGWEAVQDIHLTMGRRATFRLHWLLLFATLAMLPYIYRPEILEDESRLGGVILIFAPYFYFVAGVLFHLPGGAGTRSQVPLYLLPISGKIYLDNFLKRVLPLVALGYLLAGPLAIMRAFPETWTFLFFFVYYGLGFLVLALCLSSIVLGGLRVTRKQGLEREEELEDQSKEKTGLSRTLDKAFLVFVFFWLYLWLPFQIVVLSSISLFQYPVFLLLMALILYLGRYAYLEGIKLYDFPYPKGEEPPKVPEPLVRT